MSVVSIPSRKKSWQTTRERVSVMAALAIQKETVIRRLERLRADIGHPDKPGEPLPQDEAAARAGVTARTWQRWESGETLPYSRNLSAIADAFGIDVGEFYDEPPPAPPRGGTVAARVINVLSAVEGLVRAQNELLARQSLILERIEQRLEQDERAARELAQEGEDWAQRVLQLVRQADQGDVETPERARRKRAASGNRRG